MEKENVRRLRSAVVLLEQAQSALDPAYRREEIAVGEVDSRVLAAQALILAVLGDEADEAASEQKITLVRAEQTCYGCPSQWDAWDADGNVYYLRYRWGGGRMDLKARMTEDGLLWLDDRAPTVAAFQVPEDPMGGVISLEEFAQRAGIALGEGVA